MHLAAAAFRSIEARLPQLRVTSNGYSAAIDATGTVIAATRMGERTLVIGDVAVGELPRTLMLAWGDWVGRAAAVFLVVLAIAAAGRRWSSPGRAGAAAECEARVPRDVVVLPTGARLAAGLLRAFARASLLWMAAAFAFGEGLFQSSTFAQVLRALIEAATLAVLALRPAACTEVRRWLERLALAALYLALPAWLLSRMVAS